MSKRSDKRVIRIRGVRQNNLKNFDLDLPTGKLIVVTGPSGSGKSSLAFETLFAEGQRRYIETFSPYARQFFDRMDKPAVDSIEGIPPSIAIEQRNAVKTTRSTIGTMTEICDYAKAIWPKISTLYCSGCGREVRRDTPQSIWTSIIKGEVNIAQEALSAKSARRKSSKKPASASGKSRKSRPSKATSQPTGAVTQIQEGSTLLITFNLALSDKLSIKDSVDLIQKQGYQRIWINDEVIRLDEWSPPKTKKSLKSLSIVQDRIRIEPDSRARFVEACEQAYHFGKGRLNIILADDQRQFPESNTIPFSNKYHCAECDRDFREPSPALFSFNHPLGACPTCRGFGRVISLDYESAIPDHSLSLAEGAVKPWRTGVSAECQHDLMSACRKEGIPVDVPYEELDENIQDWVMFGEPGYGTSRDKSWPHAWYGVKGYFDWLESKSYKMHVRVQLSRYRIYQTCPDCQGNRFQPNTLCYLAEAGKGHRFHLADFYKMSVRDALAWIKKQATPYLNKGFDPIGVAMTEVLNRLKYLDQVGLGYLTLDRPSRTLSGGETERVTLTSCLGSRLVNTLFVLDEPSVGLHPRDTERLIRVLEDLRDLNNTVVVVEHEASVIRAADQIVDIGPGKGEQGGNLVFQGNFSEVLECETSLTGDYLSGRKIIPTPERRPVIDGDRKKVPFLQLTNVNKHNLQGIDVHIPLGRFVCITGVSGSGKTTLAREALYPALKAKLEDLSETVDDSNDLDESKESELAESQTAYRSKSMRLTGHESLAGVAMVDQSILGKTPRSNAALYVGAFEPIRKLFAASRDAKSMGLTAGSFSFNATAGQCERCRGVGFEKIEMQFLSDVFIKCPDCDGKRYRPHVLKARLRPKEGAAGWTIAEMLDATVSEAIEFLCQFTVADKLAFVAADRLNLLKEVGLGYLKLGQPLNTLSGGESQRLKLVKRLADFSESTPKTSSRRRGVRPVSVSYQSQTRGSFFIFDEPTTGLHFDDTRILVQVFQRLVDAGHTVVVIEHNMDVISSADWIIDLGPDAGDRGGQVVGAGTPEHLAFETETHTGKALLKEWEDREKLKSSPNALRIRNGYLRLDPANKS